MHDGCYTIWPLSFFGSTTVAAPDVLHLHVVFCILHGDRSPNYCYLVLVNNKKVLDSRHQEFLVIFTCRLV